MAHPNDPFAVAAALRAEGSEMVASGQAKIERADAIVRHAEALGSLMNDEPATQITASPSAVVRRGKQPGAISTTWKAHLRDLHSGVGERSFNAVEAAKIFKLIGGVSPAPSQVVRQFEPYVAAGYLSHIGERYRYTDEGLRKIGVDPKPKNEGGADVS